MTPVPFNSSKNGTLLEAKGLGYSKLIDDPYVAQKIADRMMSQATSQLRAASKSGTSVQWHVAEEDFAKGLRYLFRNLDGIDVIHTPIKH